MKLILVTNILEHAGFEDFVRDALAHHPDARFLVAGDLLNVFPEPGEDLDGSIYRDIHGSEDIHRGMAELLQTRLQAPASSAFVAPLKAMFSPTGKTFKIAQKIARERYRSFFERLAGHIERYSSKFLFIPGNMDYPYLAQDAISRCEERFVQIDVDHFERDGVRIGGLGGIPNTAHPFRGVTEISPYEMAASEYDRRLASIAGVDVLVTHLSPAEHPPLAEFARAHALKFLVCRAPFDFRREADFRGELGCSLLDGTVVIQVRPFEHPVNTFCMLSLGEDVAGGARIETYRWQAPDIVRIGDVQLPATRQLRQGSAPHTAVLPGA
ncbi:MAG: hypothetical protein RLZZ584_3523 [Pseudomonadota bacterium]